MDWFTIIPLVIKYGPLVKDIIDEAISNDDIVTKIKKLAGPIAPLLDSIGSQFFPAAAPALHIAAGAMAAFDPSITKWVQGTLNSVVSPSPKLTVDGLYGPKTKAAVKAFQKQLGLDVDGWAGQLTQAALTAAMAKP
jgi:peptidoglycan hydrolase-like protein with peptidoglycan-binding domain